MLTTFAPTAPAASDVAALLPLGEAPRSIDGWLRAGFSRLFRFGWPLIVVNLVGGAACIFVMGLVSAPQLAWLTVTGRIATEAEDWTAFVAGVARLPVMALWFAVACRMSLEAASGRRIPAKLGPLPDLRSLLALTAVIASLEAPWAALELFHAVFGKTLEQRFFDGGPELLVLGVRVVGWSLLGSGLALAPWFVVERGLGPIAAFAAGWRAFSGRRWTLLVVVVALCAVAAGAGRLSGPLLAPVVAACSDTVLALVYLHTARAEGREAQAPSMAS